MSTCACVKCRAAATMDTDPMGSMLTIVKWLQGRIHETLAPLGIQYHLLLAHESGPVVSATSIPPAAVPDLMRSLADADVEHMRRPKAQA